MIGGEFEIDLSQKGTFVPQPDTYYYASGRAALYQILRSLKVKCLWLPDYLCISVVEAVRRAGVQYTFYELDDDLEPRIGTLSPDEFDAILLIDYFGLKDLNPIEDRLSALFPYTVLIEDDVQAYYDFVKPVNPYVHYHFTSLRKTFAVPDGGLVYTRHKLPLAQSKNTFSSMKIQAADMKFHRSEGGDDSQYLSLFEKGEEMIDENYDSQMSSDSEALFAACDVAEAGRRRRKNAQYLLKELADFGIKTILPIPENKTPLFVPIWLENRNEIRKQMFSQAIFCPVHWPQEGMKLKKGDEMAEHELSLIVDQRYYNNHLKQILRILK